MLLAIPMFCSQYRKSFLSFMKEARILSASFLTALLCSGDILLNRPSASKSISKFKSSLPMPSKFATEFIYDIILQRFFLKKWQSLEFIRMVPFIFSLISMEQSSFSSSIAFAMYLRASFSMIISSITQSCQL